MMTLRKTIAATCLLTALLTAAGVLASGNGAIPASAQLQQHTEYAAVDKTMQTMLQAFEQGRADLAFQVIRPDTAVVGYSSKQQKITNVPGEEWAKGFQPVPDEDQRHRQYQILDITDTGALVKVLLDYPQWQGVDYLALTKVNGQWRVISKSWSGKPKTAK